MVKLPDGTEHSYLTGEEKGIDVRIAIDVIGLAWQHRYDVALIFSQDQDLSEAAREIRAIAAIQNRWLKIASAFPVSPVASNRKGIDWTDWIRLDRTAYDACIDPRDYRSRPAQKAAPEPGGGDHAPGRGVPVDPLAGQR